jgi:UDP-glucose 4-epimerase
MNIFLTGGTGFIGSYVVKILSDFDSIDKHLEGKDACIHIALGWGDMAESMLENDTRPSVHLFESAAQHKISHFIYTSSIAAVAHIPSPTGSRLGKRPPAKQVAFTESKGCKRQNLQIKRKYVDRDHPQRRWLPFDREPHPTDYYGATKAASEHYLLATSHQYPMRCNIIRPGYTFGNPVVDGAYSEPDNRFRHIAQQAKAGKPIEITRYDGAQFIWAGDLAKIYKAILEGHLHYNNNRSSTDVEHRINRRIYYGLGNCFTPWEKIARQAVTMAGSPGTIEFTDKECPREPRLFDVSCINKDFQFSFETWDRICEHLEYLLWKK